jgi:hypothetical protein
MSADAVVAPASRNSPCPCGSGRRYKDCHGALGAPGVVAAVARTSSYRAPAGEWPGVSDAEADRLGALMERALAHQHAGRIVEAARLYRDVLQAAPRTHDALHMLGVIELGAGNLEEAGRLIDDAISLRPAYPTITHNLQLVRDAFAARDRVLPEELCERALPLLFELAFVRERHAEARVSTRSAAASRALHVIGRLGDPWLMLRLSALLAPERPALWATDSVTGATLDGVRVLGIDAASGFVPRGGIHVFAGLGHADLDWIERADAERIVVVCTPAAPSRCLDELRAIGRDGARPIDMLFTGPALAGRFGDVGAVVPLPIALSAPGPSRDAARPFGVWTVSEPARFVAGIVGQDGPDVDEARDAEFLSKLARRSGALSIYDPGRLRYPLGGDAAVRCVPRTRDGFDEFVASLDCFVHRVRPWWEEGDGRALLTAWSNGVPVLCPRTSLFAAEIRHEVDGLLYSGEDEALSMVGELHRAPAWARSLAAAARARAAERFADDALAATYRTAIVAPMPFETTRGDAARQRIA